MKPGHLSQYFAGVAAKKLCDVEVDPAISNQHEFNGVNGLKAVLGTSKKDFGARFVYLADEQPDPEIIDSRVTWYDSRENQPKRAAEYRLYYPSSAVMERAKPGDLLLVALLQNDTLLVIIAKEGSTAENQIRLLFGLHEDGARYEVKTEKDTDEIELGFVGKLILELIGIEIDEVDESYLEEMLRKFSGTFPTTKEFSRYARETIPDVRARDGSDKAIITWMDREETLFRTLERYLVSIRLRQGFGETGDDVDEFVKYSLSVHNRRKSRVGHALENHLEAVFHDHSVKYSRTKETENKAKPDFLFPSVEKYHEPVFPHELLTVLGVKSTCKDRWRQVLTEANRIPQKHLFTLEPGISENQTNEMKIHQLQLVVPEGLHKTYSLQQRSWISSLTDFISMVLDRQTTAEKFQ